MGIYLLFVKNSAFSFDLSKEFEGSVDLSAFDFQSTPPAQRACKRASTTEITEKLGSSADFQMYLQMEAFAGTISAGGGSCQLSMMSNRSQELQLFSVPVGNRVPTVEGLFSKPVKPHERQHWQSRVQAELRKANFPKGLCGLYVGISAAYHAANAADAADRLINKTGMLAHLDDRLTTLKDDDVRSISNLILIRELISWVFDPQACFVFKRNWQADGETYVATWTLGFYLQQCDKIKRLTRNWGLNTTKWDSLRFRFRLNPPQSNSTGHADSLFEVPFVAWPLI